MTRTRRCPRAEVEARRRADGVGPRQAIWPRGGGEVAVTSALGLQGAEVGDSSSKAVRVAQTKMVAAVAGQMKSSVSAETSRRWSPGVQGSSPPMPLGVAMRRCRRWLDLFRREWSEPAQVKMSHLAEVSTRSGRCPRAGQAEVIGQGLAEAAHCQGADPGAAQDHVVDGVLPKRSLPAQRTGVVARDADQ